MAEKNYKQLVKDKETELKSLHDRQDEDKGLLYLDRYVMRDKDGNAIPGIINITLSDTALFAANVISSLGSASQQAVVESDDKGLDTNEIEEFQKAAMASANARLTKQGKPPLNPFFDEQLCIRGRAAFRCLFRMKDGQLIPDILPLDTRFLTYEMGSDGMEWGAPKYTRSKAMLEAEYGKELKSQNITIGDKGEVVTDVWDKKINEIWIGEKKVKEQPNPYGFVPIGLQTVPLGSMLQDKDSLAHYGESIFFLIRDIIPELNRLVSILQTLNLAAVKGAKQYATKEGPTAETPEGADEMGAMTPVEIGGGITLVPIADIKRAATLLHSMMESRMQRGSLSSIDLGNLTFPLSAVALVEIGEGRDQVFLPRLQAKALLNQQLAQMFTAQVIQTGQSVELGTAGHKRTFDIGKLTGEYETTYKYFTKSPKIDIARYSVATAAERYLDEDTILRDVLQAEDPDGIKRKRYYDMAAKLSPVVMMNRVVKSLLEAAKKGDKDAEFEAELLSAEMGMSLKQIMAGELPTPPKAEKPAEPILPLLGGAGSRTSAKRAAELEATPRAEEGEE